MRTKILSTGDWHLTDRPSDEYRWTIFDTVKTLIRRHRVTSLVVLGDITHFKDHHPSRLISRLISSLMELSDLVDLHVLMGNHDYSDPLCPLLAMLKPLERDHKIRFYDKPTETTIDDLDCLFIPHQLRWRTGIYGLDITSKDIVFVHQCFKGAVVGGRTLDGETTRALRVCGGLVIGGDIHEPQKVGPVIYTGSPHPVAFGDDFQPRVLLIENTKSGLICKSVNVDAPAKRVLRVSSVDDIDLNEFGPKDQVKVVLEVVRGSLGNADSARQAIRDKFVDSGVYVAGIEIKLIDTGNKQTKDIPTSSSDARSMLTQYCKARKIGKGTRRVGMRLL